jgi:hypothetical protein
MLGYNTPPRPPLPSTRLFMVLFWLNLATALGTCLHGLTGRYAAGALLGLFAGPAIYLLADGFGALRLARPLWLTVPICAALWAVALPLILDLYACAHKSRQDG